MGEPAWLILREPLLEKNESALELLTHLCDLVPLIVELLLNLRGSAQLHAELAPDVVELILNRREDDRLRRGRSDWSRWSSWTSLPLVAPPSLMAAFPLLPARSLLPAFFSFLSA
jgi:hypothetical protein